MNSRLGKKVTIAVLAATILTAALSSAIQVRMELNNDIGELRERLNRIDPSFIDSVSDAVWQVDERRSVFLLKILKEKLQLSTVKLSSPDLGNIVLGEQTVDPEHTRLFKLTVKGSGSEVIQLGTLTASLSMKPVYSQLKKRIVFIGSVNIVRTIVLAIILLFIANRFVTRRLKEFTEAINQFPKHSADAAGTQQTILLSKPPIFTGSDEIDELAETYSKLRLMLSEERSKLDQSNIILAEKVKELETAVDEKTTKEQELMAAKKELEEALRTKSVFVANTSHELRTPLTAILGFLEILRQNLGNPADVRKYLTIIDRNSKHLLELVNDVLTFSGSDEHVLRLHRTPLSLRRFLSETVDNIRNLAESKGIDLTIRYQMDHDVVIDSDPHRIRQVMNNLIGNAIKFTENGFVKIVCLQVQARKPGSVAFQISVEDSGVGISSSDSIRIFDPFVQSDDSHTRSFGGSGLGLTIAKKVAGLLGGDVILSKSAPGKGSEFIFSLEAELVAVVPIAPTIEHFGTKATDVHWEDSTKSDKKESIFSHRSIVVVDDNPDNLALMSAILNRSGATVLAASDGRSAVDATLKNQPDLVLMDIQMPGVNGYTAAQSLRDFGFSNPIIAVTAKADESEQVRCVMAGFNGLITKPIDIDHMLTLIQENLG